MQTATRSNTGRIAGITAVVRRLENLVAKQQAGDPIPDSEIEAVVEHILDAVPVHTQASAARAVQRFITACQIHYRALYAPEHFADLDEMSNQALLSAARLDAANRALRQILQDVLDDHIPPLPEGIGGDSMEDDA